MKDASLIRFWDDNKIPRPLSSWYLYLPRVELPILTIELLVTSSEVMPSLPRSWPLSWLFAPPKHFYCFCRWIRYSLPPDFYLPLLIPPLISSFDSWNLGISYLVCSHDCLLWITATVHEQRYGWVTARLTTGLVPLDTGNFWCNVGEWLKEVFYRFFFASYK